MLLSIALILLCGSLLGTISKKLRLPALLGMLITGILLGPYVFNLLDEKILLISADLRKIALIIILTRAGLGLDLNGLKKMGRPAFLMCFVPATLEIIAVTILAPLFFGINYLEAALLGSVLAAVSPAVVVPRMVKLTEEGYGTKQGIPQMILAGASVDDVYVIVLFTTFLSLLQGGEVSILSFINIPVSIILGILIGILSGEAMGILFKKYHLRDTAKVLFILSYSFILVSIEEMLATPINFSALIAVMFIGVGLQMTRNIVAKRLSLKYGKLWVGAEVFLFVLVGASVNISYLKGLGLIALVLILLALIFRMFGVSLCLLKTDLNKKERLFTMMAYTPKATVQAAIGGVPLALGLNCGDIILSIAVLAIVFSAPLGAFMIDSSYKKLLQK
ncbi:MAG: cation:proton antiporter [Erysipelotrichaceae bacterium]|nr:cation:proton antiporter [Erysipelotrichaceae bacterium]